MTCSRTEKKWHERNSLDLFVMVRAAAAIFLSVIAVGILFIILINTGVLEEPNNSRPFLPFIALALVALLMLCLSIVLTHHIMRPANSVVEALDNVAEGDFSTRLDMTGNASIVRINDSFNAMAKELESTELLRTSFIDDFSHEFKTPMVSVRGFARQIERDETASDEVREYARIIGTETDRLLNMANNVLQLDRFENQQLVPNATTYDLAEQLRTCIVLLQRNWEERDLTFDLDDVQSAEIYSNDEMLQQVWVNIFDNAVKYSPYGGTITVSCEPADDAVCVRVRDEGPGMDKMTQERAFDKFYRGPQANGSTVGNGLGLPLVQRIVTLLKGTITLQSELGQGTEIIVTLPQDINQSQTV